MTEAASNVSPRDPNPVLVVGLFRSGTSLLHSLLNQHPQVALMYECSVWDFPRVFSRLRFRRNWLERQEFHNFALSRHRLISDDKPLDPQQVKTPEELYRAFSNGKGTAVWGEKSPLYGPRLRQLAQRYPSGSFILIWRDPVEIYRSVLQAGRAEPYFRRFGMLSRLIFFQEHMTRQVAALHGSGVRMHHVTYADLTDDPKSVCAGVCRFLGIEFDEKMLDLTTADFSAVYRSQPHDHLRQGVIARRQFAGEIVSPAAASKLQRFRTRWDRLQSPWLGTPPNPPTEPEPSLAERLYHGAVGSLLFLLDGAKRLLTEFLPLPWLHAYRLLGGWFSKPPSDQPARPLTPWQLFCRHWITVVTSLVILAGVAALDFYSSPKITLAPFYFIPVAVVTLVISLRWGTIAAMTSATVWSLLEVAGKPISEELGVVLWNIAMRFVILQAMVVVIHRVRLEMTRPQTVSREKPPSSPQPRGQAEKPTVATR